MAQKTYFRNAPKMGYRESLFFCGCPSCINEIKSWVAEEIPYQTGFLDYVATRYPETLAKVNKE